MLKIEKASQKIDELRSKNDASLDGIEVKVQVAEKIVDYAVALSRNTRPENEATPQFVKDWVSWGAGPRASQYLILAAKAKAVLSGRPNASFEDVKAVAKPVLRHRVLTNFNAEADGITSVDIIDKLLDIDIGSLA